MISRETENVQSAREVIEAFRALTTGEKQYITANELFAVSKVSALRYEVFVIQDVCEVQNALFGVEALHMKGVQ